ncbi:MAG: hypothetical protein KatS3mg008_0745 [Acidimicrobiales bacterium]|nr:MAG: hypothetical protein KatS3mg008_0745 [Acidimicrobiales bacterium]
MKPKRVVVDGSNLATEGRRRPSLKQLDEAVTAFLRQHEFDELTVVVDATFAHRIDPSERKAFQEAVDAGEIVVPPAGVVGRGDAFVLEIAQQTGATVLSNDSFAEFQDEFPWLFDEGRLIGGKPIPGVGWVFVERVPVRASRRGRVPTRKETGEDVSPEHDRSSTRVGSSEEVMAPSRSASSGADEAPGERTTNRPDDRPTTVRTRRDQEAAEHGASVEPEAGYAPRRLNDPVTFLHFVAEHPLGSIVEGVVEGFASHGAYVRVGEARCYISVKQLGDPPPNTAKKVLRKGERRAFVVHAIDTPRRGIDLALAPGRYTTVKSDVTTTHPRHTEADGSQGVPPQIGGSHESRKTATGVGDVARTLATERTLEEAPVTPAKKATAKKTAAKKTTAKKAAAKKTTAKKATAKKTAAKKTTAKKAAAKKTTAKKATAKKTAAKKTTAKKAAAKKTTAKKATAKKTAAKKA